MKVTNPITVLLIGLIFFILLSCDKRSSSEADLRGYPYDFVRRISDQVNYSLETNEVLNYEIRLWIKLEASTSSQLYILKEINSNTYLNKFHLELREDSFSYELDNCQAWFEKPNIQTSDIINKLYRLGFKELKSQPDSVKKRIGDGTSYILELRDSTYYGAINYNSPHLFMDYNSQAFLKILKDLESDLKFEYLEY